MIVHDIHKWHFHINFIENSRNFKTLYFYIINSLKNYCIFLKNLGLTVKQVGKRRYHIRSLLLYVTYGLMFRSLLNVIQSVILVVSKISKFFWMSESESLLLSQTRDIQITRTQTEVADQEVKYSGRDWGVLLLIFRKKDCGLPLFFKLKQDFPDQ